MKQTYGTLQMNFDDTVETFVEENPAMEIEEAENEAYQELRPEHTL